MFQGPMNVFPGKLKLAALVFYLDYIFIFSRAPERYADHEPQNLAQCKEIKLKFKLNNCLFLTDANNCIGLVIRRKRLEIATHTSDAMQRKKQIRSIIVVQKSGQYLDMRSALSGRTSISSIKGHCLFHVMCCNSLWQRTYRTLTL